MLRDQGGKENDPRTPELVSATTRPATKMTRDQPARKTELATNRSRKTEVATNLTRKQPDSQKSLARKKPDSQRT